MNEREPSRWEQQVRANPGHSEHYVHRFRTMAQEGVDIVGEARLIDAMLPRGGRVLDAGCGPGRVGGYLHRAGHTVVGVDVDPVLIAAARHDHPGPQWQVGDLSELDLRDQAGERRVFDVIVCAGNVMAFLAPSTRRAVLARLAEHLDGEGRAVIGFGSGRDYAFEQFLADAESSGLRAVHRLATWDLRPFTPDSEFLVCVLQRADAPAGG